MATTNARVFRREPGDWFCQQCNEINFKSRTVCRRCSSARNELAITNSTPTTSQYVPKQGDWICHPCQTNNFSNHTACHKSNRAKPISMQIDASAQKATVKPGDWKCSSCPEMNFGSRVVCRTCGAARPSIETNNSNTKSECVICMDKPIDSVITNCGHSAVCLECSGSITQCPICRNSFNQQQIIKLYNVH